jgi:hypothetical protein
MPARELQGVMAVGLAPALGGHGLKAAASRHTPWGENIPLSQQKLP